MSQTRYTVPYSHVGSLASEEELEVLRTMLLADTSLSCGQARRSFEAEFRAFSGAAHALTMTNCTIALEFAFQLCDLRPGDEVIAVSQTYQATIQPLLSRPDVVVKFCDIDRITLNASAASIEELITSRTRVIVLVHHGGVMADMPAIMTLARRHGVLVIEDCAHAVGSSIEGIAAGAWGDFGCFSFQSFKNMTTLGEGGMLTLASDTLAVAADRMRSIESVSTFEPLHTDDVAPWHALAGQVGVDDHSKNAFTATCVEISQSGTNSTLSEPACAVGSVQLRRVAENNLRRSVIARRLDEVVLESGVAQPQACPSGFTNAHHLYTFVLDQLNADSRASVVKQLEAGGIEIVLRYFPIHLLPEWRLRAGPQHCPVTEQIWFGGHINLPIYPHMTEHQLELMCAVLATTLRSVAR